MQHFYSLQGVSLQAVWLTIGVFDGVHRGHRQIIEKLTTGARTAGVPAVVLTFSPHPAVVLGGPQKDFCLTTPEERAALLAEVGVDVVITYPFSRVAAAIPARDFMMTLLDKLGVQHLLIGHDFSMGRNREGDAAYLSQLGEELGFGFEQISAVLNGDEVISSTHIRELLRAGELERANELLGSVYQITGEVVKGDGRGSRIGIPTANIIVPHDMLVPANGVYACRVWVDGKSYSAATNIGVRPTFYESDAPRTIEAHLLDFSGDVYGKDLRVEFLVRLRAEQKFDGIESLVAQIHADIESTRALRLD